MKKYFSYSIDETNKAKRYNTNRRRLLRNMLLKSKNKWTFIKNYMNGEVPTSLIPRVKEEIDDRCPEIMDIYKIKEKLETIFGGNFGKIK